MERTCRSQRFKSIKKCSFSDDRDSKSQDDNVKKNIKQKSNNSKSCEVVSKLLIPEDLMFDILGLVPVHCLVNSARYVCKSWATIIHSPIFIEASLHRAHSKLGFYVEHGNSRNSYFLDIKDDVNGQFEFERIDLGTPPGMGTIVSSCDGILLLRHSYRDLLVVNPILKSRLIIPPLSISEHCIFTIARVPHTTMFKLFFIDILEVSDAFWYVFYVLRIGIDKSLKEITRKEAPWKSNWLRKLFYSGGKDLYYITKKGLTVLDIEKEIIVGEYPPPPVEMWYDPIRTRSLSWMGDHLSCIARKSVHDYKTYKIYILDFDLGKWSFNHEMRPLDFSVACCHETIILGVIVRLWINDQIIFQVYIRKKRDIYPNIRSIHFSYNVKTRQFKKIEDIAEEKDIMVWLHTNSLVSFPSTST